MPPALSRKQLALYALAAIAFVACATVGVRALVRADHTDPVAPKAASVPSSDSGSGSFLKQVVPGRGGGPLPGAEAPARIAAAVRAMPIEEKVAQTMLLGFSGRDLSAPVYTKLRKRALGGVVFLRRNWVSAEQVTAMAGQATLVARQAKHIPPFVLTIQDGGEFNELPGLPPANAPAELKSADEGGAEAAEAAKALAEANFSGVLGPSLDVGTGSDDAVGAQAFSNLAPQVARYGVAVLAAYRREGLLAAAAHFPGEGAATQAVEDGPASVGLSADQLFKRDQLPFRTAIRAGAPAFVISNASYVFDDFVVPGTQSGAVSTDNLRAVLGFRGVAIADDLAEPAITNSMSVADAAVGALKAGSDMLYISGTAHGQKAAYDALVAAVRDGSVPIARLDEAVTRVLTLKRELGLVKGLRPRTRVRPEAAAAVPPGVVPPGTVPPAGVPGAVPGAPAPGTPAAPAPTP